jgi:hypothetical protein
VALRLGLFECDRAGIGDRSAGRQGKNGEEAGFGDPNGFHSTSPVENSR